MATAIIGGLLNTGFNPKDIIVYEPWAEGAQKLRDQFKVYTASSNSDAVNFKPFDCSVDVKSADVVIFAVKPQIMKTVATELADDIQKFKPLVISIAAGIRVVDLDQWLGGQVAIVRTMPNTPALVGEGATAMCASTHVTEKQRQDADIIIKAISAKMYTFSSRLMKGTGWKRKVF